MGILSVLRKLLVRDIDPAIATLYGVCVDAARRPAFYESYGVPDTVDGRFDLLLFHVVPVILCLDHHATVRQKLFDLMFADMERSLREMGVGDMSIGKKMKPMLAGFYGRATAYKSALEQATDEQLIAAISKNVYALADGTAPEADALARYMRRMASSLAAQNESDVAAGNLSFPSFPQ